MIVLLISSVIFTVVSLNVNFLYLKQNKSYSKQIAGSDETNQSLICDPWPENLKPVRDCCNIPHNSNSILMSHCFFKCHTNGTDGNEQNDCAARCYANATLLINDDGKLNKNVAKRIYGNSAYNEQRWMKLINDSVDECEYNESGVLAENLAKFFECINENLENNCVDFVNSQECDKVQEHFEKCHNFEPDCKHWPQTLINPEVCCITPRLFSQQQILSCRRKCLVKELFLQRQIKCVDNCLFNDTKVKENGRFDFAVIHKLLIENSKSQPDWEKSIENAVEKCEKKMKGFMMFSHLVLEQF